MRISPFYTDLISLLLWIIVCIPSQLHLILTKVRDNSMFFYIYSTLCWGIWSPQNISHLSLEVSRKNWRLRLHWPPMQFSAITWKRNSFPRFAVLLAKHRKAIAIISTLYYLFQRRNKMLDILPALTTALGYFLFTVDCISRLDLTWQDLNFLPIFQIRQTNRTRIRLDLIKY